MCGSGIEEEGVGVFGCFLFLWLLWISFGVFYLVIFFVISWFVNIIFNEV